MKREQSPIVLVQVLTTACHRVCFLLNLPGVLPFAIIKCGGVSTICLFTVTGLIAVPSAAMKSENGFDVPIYHILVVPLKVAQSRSALFRIVRQYLQQMSQRRLQRTAQQAYLQQELQRIIQQQLQRSSEL